MAAEGIHPSAFPAKLPDIEPQDASDEEKPEWNVLGAPPADRPGVHLWLVMSPGRKVMDLDRETRERLKALGYRNVGWHVVATDWEPDAAEQIESTVVDGVIAHGDGAIVLLHAWPAGTLAALPGIARRLRDRGGQFVRVDQLERIPELPAGDVAPVPG